MTGALLSPDRTHNKPGLITFKRLPPGSYTMSMHKKVGAKRGESYSSDECVVIVKANLSARRNAHGIIESHEFRDMFMQVYKQHRNKSWPERSIDSLISKWDEISSTAQKFKGCWRRAKTDLEKKSGQPFND